MRRIGMSGAADELVLTMNRAAEAAVPEAKTLLIDAVKSMSVADPKATLSGGDDSATQYFRARTQTALAAKFRPIVHEATQKVGTARSYDALTSKLSQYVLVDAKSINLDDYVTTQALEGLYEMIAMEELATQGSPRSVEQASAALFRIDPVNQPPTRAGAETLTRPRAA